jgi:hypothetical protein
MAAERADGDSAKKENDRGAEQSCLVGSAT